MPVPPSGQEIKNKLKLKAFKGPKPTHHAQIYHESDPGHALFAQTQVEAEKKHKDSSCKPCKASKADRIDQFAKKISDNRKCKDNNKGEKDDGEKKKEAKTSSKDKKKFNSATKDVPEKKKKS